MIHFVRDETRLGSILLSALMLLSVGGKPHTIKNEQANFMQHPQEQLCAADIAIHAKVLPRNHTEEGEKHVIRVYELKILQIYKGGDLLVSNQTKVVNGVQVNGSGEVSLLIRAYADGVQPLTKGAEYLLTGKPRNGSILINAGSWVELWSAVTPAYRAGISGIYAQNCECQITPCFWKSCKPHLKGCDVPALWEFYQSCKWRHSYCVKNEEGSACSWYDTAEYMNCMSQIP